MTVWYIIMIVISLGLAALFTYRRAVRTDITSLFLKTAASFAFLILGCVSWKGSADVSSILILPGLAAGLIGDIYLDLKYVHAKTSVIYTFAGFCAFMIGHIFYFCFLVTEYGVTLIQLIICLVIGIIAGIAIYVTPTLMNLDYGRFRLISSVYAGLLVFVTVYSGFLFFAALFAGAFSLSRLLFFIGIVLFLISDLVLSQIYFGEDKNTPKNSMINHGTYYLGQILIAASVFFI